MSAEAISGMVAREWDVLLEREDAAFAALVHRQSRFVFRLAYALPRNAEDAEDVVQEAFFKLFRSGEWKKMRDERAFLARAAWRIAIDKQPHGWNASIEAPEFASAAQSVEGALIDEERRRALHRMIDALPERLRRPLSLSTVAELSTFEIASLLEMPESSVRRLLSEARALLKEKLARMEAKHARA